LQIAPNTPLKNLLPVAPKTQKITILAENLNSVPEVEFQGLVKELQVSPADSMANTIAKINHLNQKKTDGFLELFRAERSDLNGLPFAMGDACRTKGERTKQFTQAVDTVRKAMSRQRGVPPPQINAPVANPAPSPPPLAPTAESQQPSQSGIGVGGLEDAPAGELPAATFWTNYEKLCKAEDKALSKVDQGKCEHVAAARIAALTQILGPLSPDYRLGLVKYLSAISHVEATRAIAKLAIFTTEDEVRLAACAALKVRREKDYNDILLGGLRYPFPAVARRTTEAIVKLERADLIPQLLTMLEDADPRTPVQTELEGKKVAVVREMVKLNHHRNCLMCHAPGNTGTVSEDALAVTVPVPGLPMSQPSEGYMNGRDPDLLVRVDVTYLRQDFSVMQAVGDAHPWPEMQRFDFMVRSRTISTEEAGEFKQKLETREPGVLSPYHRAALAALRELTGKDTEPTAKAWRQLLKMPAK
jgi:hypothetical protein